MNLRQHICAAAVLMAVSIGAVAQDAAIRGAATDLVAVEQSAGTRQYRLSRATGLPMVSGCAAATVLRMRESAAGSAIGEPAIVELALRTGRLLKLGGARCEADGSVSASAVALEPENATPADLCALPRARGSAAQCR